MSDATPPWILLPGWAFSPAVFSSWITTLGPTAEAHALAISEAAPSADDALTATVESVLRDAPERARWVGWSLGGMIALAAAAMAPERVIDLTLIASTPRFARTADWPHAVDPGSLQRFRDGLSADLPRTLHRFAALCAQGCEDVMAVSRVLGADLRNGQQRAPAVLETGLAMLTELDLRALLPRVRTRLRWILGGGDPLVPVTVQADLRALRPDMEFLQLDGAGHAPFLSHGRACAEFVLA